MEIACADCGCRIERGVRTEPCAGAECCCRALPTRTIPGLDEIAARIATALTTEDTAAFAELLADDTRWGDDDNPRKCRTRGEVLATLHRLQAEGVRGEVVETIVGPNGAACHLRLHPPPGHPLGRDSVFHVYLISDGHIHEIRPVEERAAAVAELHAPSPRSGSSKSGAGSG